MPHSYYWRVIQLHLFMDTSNFELQDSLHQKYSENGCVATNAIWIGLERMEIMGRVEGRWRCKNNKYQRTWRHQFLGWRLCRWKSVASRDAEMRPRGCWSHFEFDVKQFYLVERVDECRCWCEPCIYATSPHSIVCCAIKSIGFESVGHENRDSVNCPSKTFMMQWAPAWSCIGLTWPLIKE